MILSKKWYRANLGSKWAEEQCIRAPDHDSAVTFCKITPFSFEGFQNANIDLHGLNYARAPKSRLMSNFYLPPFHWFCGSRVTEESFDTLACTLLVDPSMSRSTKRVFRLFAVLQPCGLYSLYLLSTRGALLHTYTTSELITHTRWKDMLNMLNGVPD